MISVAGRSKPRVSSAGKTTVAEPFRQRRTGLITPGSRHPIGPSAPRQAARTPPIAVAAGPPRRARRRAPHASTGKYRGQRRRRRRPQVGGAATLCAHAGSQDRSVEDGQVVTGVAEGRADHHADVAEGVYTRIDLRRRRRSRSARRSARRPSGRAGRRLPPGCEVSARTNTPAPVASALSTIGRQRAEPEVRADRDRVGASGWPGRGTPRRTRPAVEPMSPRLTSSRTAPRLPASVG